MLIAVAPLLVPAAFMVIHHPRIDWANDRALTELAVRQAAHGRQLLGIGGRFGWRHPGPLWIYLLVPLYELTGHGAWSLALGAVVIHVVMIAAAVGAAARSAGTRGAMVLSALITVYLMATGLGLWTNLWAGYTFTWPMLALVVIASIGTADVRAGWALAATVAIGTLLVQTDVSTIVPVVAIAGVATAVRLVRFGGRRVFAGPRAGHGAGHGTAGAAPQAYAVHARGARRVRIVDPSAVALFSASALAWLPPLIQQLTTAPGNMTLLVRFARQGAGGQSIGTALSAVGAALSVLPFGRRWVLSPELTAHLAPGPWWATPLAIIYAVGLAAAAIVAYRRGRRWAGDLAVLTLIALVAAVISMSRVDGTINYYLLTWISILPIAGLTAVVLAVAPPQTPTRRRDPVAALATILGVVLAVALVVGQGTTFDWDRLGSADVSYTTALAQAGLGPAKGANRGVVRIHILTQDTWRTASGVAVQLERDGRRIQVDPDWVFLFGDAFRPTKAPEEGELWFARAHETALLDGVAHVSRVGTVDGIVVFARRD